jgi:hypothetical protein
MEERGEARIGCNDYSSIPVSEARRVEEIPNIDRKMPFIALRM